MRKVQRKMDSKIGPLYLVASESHLCGVFWEDQNLIEEQGKTTESARLDEAERQIHEYLDGKRKTFDLALDSEGTEFQKRVWEELKKIPYGETRSYKQIAESLNAPKGSRAVGTANGRNPLSLIVPCHRVISSDGSMGGYAGGLPIKEKLLTLEKSGKLD